VQSTPGVQYTWVRYPVPGGGPESADVAQCSRPRAYRRWGDVSCGPWLSRRVACSEADGPQRLHRRGGHRIDRASDAYWPTARFVATAAKCIEADRTVRTTRPAPGRGTVGTHRPTNCSRSQVNDCRGTSNQRMNLVDIAISISLKCSATSLRGATPQPPTRQPTGTLIQVNYCESSCVAALSPLQCGSREQLRLWVQRLGT
jgi:hypothetical protein